MNRPMLPGACLALALALALVLCAPGPPVAAAGSDATPCAGCHEKVTESWARTPHGKLAGGDWYGNSQGCASCHGPVDRHLDEASPESIRRYPGELAAADNQLCLGCHSTTHALAAWSAGPHAMAGLSCLSCHDVHPAADDPRVRAAAAGRRAKEDPAERCYGCHPEVRSEMRLPSRHPVLEGKMDCQSCHNPHGANDGLLATDLRKSDLCYSCHPAQQGPFVFQHAPVEEDCGYCHRPHGSVADKLLDKTEPFLCLQCHEAHFHTGLQSPDVAQRTIGGQVRRNPYGTNGWKVGMLTKCTQCHSAVHGSDSPSQGVSGRGAALGH